MEQLTAFEAATTVTDDVVVSGGASILKSLAMAYDSRFRPDGVESEIARLVAELPPGLTDSELQARMATLAAGYTNGVRSLLSSWRTTGEGGANLVASDRFTIHLETPVPDHMGQFSYALPYLTIDGGVENQLLDARAREDIVLTSGTQSINYQFSLVVDCPAFRVTFGLVPKLLKKLASDLPRESDFGLVGLAASLIFFMARHRVLGTATNCADTIRTYARVYGL